MSVKKTTEEFEKELKEKYPDLILKSNYINSHTKITLGCARGHTWGVSPTNLLTHGTRSFCRECKGLSKVKFEWDSAKDLELKKLVDEGISTEEICSILNTNKVSIDNRCSNLGLVRDRFDYTTKPKILNRLNELNYELIKLPNSNNGLLTYKCDHGHLVTQIAGNFIRGHDCPLCPKQKSSNEIELLEFIKSIYPGWIEENDRTILNGKEIDIVLPDLGLAFEFNGIYWHSDIHVDKYYHFNKTNNVQNFGYQLIHIYEDTWNNKKDLIKSKIKALLGLNTRIYARECTIKEIPYPKDFLNNNHLQGAGSPSKYNYGLFYNDELVSVMTFSKPRFNTNYDYELVRFCSLTDITVVGGASKLFKAFNKGSIISYSNRTWSNGNLYKQLGFTYLHTSDPNYRYFKRLDSLSRYECQKHLLKEKFPESYSDNLTEAEIMKLEGYTKVYDSGNDVWGYCPVTKV